MQPSYFKLPRYTSKVRLKTTTTTDCLTSVTAEAIVIVAGIVTVGITTKIATSITNSTATISYSIMTKFVADRLVA